jgi:hypothetical protein
VVGIKKKRIIFQREKQRGTIPHSIGIENIVQDIVATLLKIRG